MRGAAVELQENDAGDWPRSGMVVVVVVVVDVVLVVVLVVVVEVVVVASNVVDAVVAPGIPAFQTL